MTVRPRNTLVLLDLVEQKAAQLVGAVVLPTANSEDAEAIVVAIGPGNIAADGGISDTHDLRPGQRVLVRAYVHHPQRGRISAALGVVVENGKRYYLFEQGQIMAILEPAPQTVN